MNTHFNQTIRTDLFSMCDVKYKEFQKNLCPGVDNIIGVRIPVLRKYAKKLAKGDWRSYLEHAQGDYYEEVMLQGLVLGYAKADFDTLLTCLASFIPKIDNWAVCDSSCISMKFIKEDKERYLRFLQPYLQSSNEFEIRFAVVCLLNYYIESQYIDYVLHQMNQIECNTYYVQMAVAWTVSECYPPFPEKTVEFLKTDSLDTFTHNKSIQKMTESRRVTSEEKISLRKLKR